MENLKKLIKELFQSVDKYFLTRQYFFAIIITLFILKVESDDFSLLLLIYTTISMILYPFAKLTFNSAFSFIFGENMIILLPLPLMILVKIAVSLLLYGFAIIIAPASMVYILIRNRYVCKK